MKSFQNFSFIILSIVFQSLGGIFGKYAALSLSAPSLIGIMTNAFYILGLACLFFQALIWQQALIRYPLSFAYPFMSLVNFVVLIASVVLFHEEIALTNVIGLCIISIGITALSRERGRPI
jgi:multidrug transporter EmrE-like cation transporter